MAKKSKNPLQLRRGGRINGPATGYVQTDWATVKAENPDWRNEKKYKWPCAMFFPDALSNPQCLALFKKALPVMRREAKEYFAEQRKNAGES